MNGWFRHSRVGFAHHFARSSLLQEKKWWAEPTLHGIAARAVQVLPPIPLLHDRLQILLPYDAVLNRVLDDCADEARRHVRRAELAVAEVAGQGHPAVDDADGLGGAHGAAGALDLG